MPSTDPQVLITGAGPTGLALALWLARKGVPVRLIDKNKGPGEASRALVVHARTLEFYQQLGFAEETVARGIKMNGVHLREDGEDKGHFDLGNLAEGVSPYPFMLTLPQNDHEVLLGEKVREAGVEIEWQTPLESFEDQGESVLCRVGGTEVSVPFLCGCDGARSTVRHGLNLGFEGGTYEQEFFVADVDSGPQTDQDLQMCLSNEGFVAVMPVRSSGMSRLIGVLPPEMRNRDDLAFDDVRAFSEKLLGLPIGAANWFSTYKVHHRLADRFRVGRVFIAGDAGHIHSPAGGQGLNTGVGDAFNLAWKLAAVLQGHAAPVILDSYEPERMAFARVLLESTDRAFRVMAGDDAFSRVFRGFLLPNFGPFALGLSATRRAMFRTMSQTRINYRESFLSGGDTGDIEGGDRLPWAEDIDNFAPLSSLDWQVHVYGEESVETEFPLHLFPWSKDAEEAGLKRNAPYLIRPDGYVALAGEPAKEINSYRAEFGLS
jgi:2-polyprenyl-6-methoxyphenol hydroxylase-like FAD-dependent oxidoreductase